MNKILLVIRREYMTRVRKPSFWLLTLLVPIMLAALYAIPIYLAMKPLEKSVVLVADESASIATTLCAPTATLHRPTT